MKRFLTNSFLIIFFMGSVGMASDFQESPDEKGGLSCSTQKILGEYAKEPLYLNIYDQVEKAEITALELDIQEADRALQEMLKKRPTDFILKYLLARVNLAWGNFYIDIKQDKKRAKGFMEQALDLVEESITLHDEFSDAYRLSGDLYGILIDLKISLIFGPLYGPSADKRIARGIEINPQNPEAYLALGRNYLYKPVLFGGSRKKAIQSFQKSIEICPSFHEGYLWLGEAYRLMGEEAMSKKSFLKVLELAPNNGWAKRVLKNSK